MFLLHIEHIASGERTRPVTSDGSYLYMNKEQMDAVMARPCQPGHCYGFEEITDV